MSTDVSAPPVTYGVHSEVGKLRNTVFSGIVDGIQPFTLRPDDRDGSVAVIEETRPFVDVVADALGIDELRIIETGGDAYATERQRWDSGNNLVAIEPGVVVAYDRNIHTNSLPAQGRHRGHHDRRRRARPRTRRRPLHDLPTHPRPAPRLTDPEGRTMRRSASFAPRSQTPSAG
jgi:hypothetical protein